MSSASTTADTVTTQQPHNHDHTHDHHHHHHHHHEHDHDHSHPHSHSHSHSHSHDHPHSPLTTSSPSSSSFTHSHDGVPEHSHPSTPGTYSTRDPYSSRDYTTRPYTIGIGGPVGSGKVLHQHTATARTTPPRCPHAHRRPPFCPQTALVLSLCRRLSPLHSVIVVTNDIFTTEDCDFLHRHHALGPAGNARIRAVETGGCPHAAIREDCSHNLTQLHALAALHHPTHLALVESGGDNLAANYSRELADYIIYVIDVAGGDKVPRKGGPGITQSDLLVVNKTDVAGLVGADLGVMEREARGMREGVGPVVMAQVKWGVGMDEIERNILDAWEQSGAKAVAMREVELAAAAKAAEGGGGGGGGEKRKERGEEGKEETKEGGPEEGEGAERQGHTSGVIDRVVGTPPSPPLCVSSASPRHAQ